MTNKLTDERVLQRLSQFEGAYKEACAFQDDDFASECADIVRVLREVLERRKADDAEPIYQNYPDDGWSDCSKEIYEKLTELGCRTRIVYAAPPVSVVPEECPAELPYAQVKAVADLFALCWRSGEVVTYTPDPEKATIWLNNYSGTCVQEYVKLEDALETENAELQERRKAEASAPVMVAECAICGKSYTNANHPVKAVTIESPLSTSERAELQAFRRAACNHGFPPGAHTQGVIGCVKCSGRLVMMWEQPNGGDCES